MKNSIKFMALSSLSILLSGCTGIIVPPMNGNVISVPVHRRHSQVVYNVPTHSSGSRVYRVATSNNIYHFYV